MRARGTATTGVGLLQLVHSCASIIRHGGQEGSRTVQPSSRSDGGLQCLRCPCEANSSDHGRGVLQAKGRIQCGIKILTLKGGHQGALPPTRNAFAGNLDVAFGPCSHQVTTPSIPIQKASRGLASSTIPARKPVWTTCLGLTSRCLRIWKSRWAAGILRGVLPETMPNSGRSRAEDGRVLFSDAGHGLTLLIRAEKTWERLVSRELPVGLLPETTWHSFEIYLHPGDMIVSLSDGVLDLFDGTLTAIDEIALLATAATSASGMVEALQKLASGTANPDDVTILAVRRTAQQPTLLGPRESSKLTPASEELADAHPRK